MNERLTSQERIRNKKDFLLLYRNGSRARGRYFNFVYLASDFPFSRVGVVVSKKVGHAVKRNKIKRWMRYLFRRNKELFLTPLDVVVVATREMAGANWQEVEKEFIDIIKRISRKGSSR